MTELLAEALKTPVLVRPQVVLDTSAIVADPEGVFAGYPGCDIVVPLVVLEELDGLKKRLDPVGRAARTALRAVERLRLDAGGDLTTALDLDGDSSLRVALNGIDGALLVEHGLSVDKPDNRIIGAALGLLGRAPDVTVVSADAAVRLKAATFGLGAVDHHVSTDRPALQAAGWVERDVPAGVIDEVFAGGRGAQSPELADALDGTGPNTFAVLKAGSQSALVRCRADGVEVLHGEAEPWGMRPRNKEQRFALSLLLDPDVPVVALDGSAGTGKTLCAVAAGLEQVVESRRYQRLCVYRPVIPVGKADLGYLPGTLDDKLDPWMAAITDAVHALTERRSPEDARAVIEQVKAEGRLVMESVTHLRGRTLHDSFILVDEAQNLPPEVVRTIITRLGDGSKVVFTGDTSQIDAAFLSEATCGLSVLVGAFAGQSCFGHIRLTKGERSRVAELAATLLG